MAENEKGVNASQWTRSTEGQKKLKESLKKANKAQNRFKKTETDKKLLGLHEPLAQ